MILILTGSSQQPDGSRAGVLLRGRQAEEDGAEAEPESAGEDRGGQGEEDQ